jgi:hypothetical protein
MGETICHNKIFPRLDDAQEEYNTCWISLTLIEWSFVDKLRNVQFFYLLSLSLKLKIVSFVLNNNCSASWPQSMTKKGPPLTNDELMCRCYIVRNSEENKKRTTP